MSEHWPRVQEYVLELDLKIVHTDAAEELLIVEDEANGIKNLVIDCEDPILVLEQLILDLPEDVDSGFYRRLLQMNRTLVHGAFVLDSNSQRLFWRDTLRLSTLDLGELEGSISALSLALAEHASELLDHVQAAA